MDLEAKKNILLSIVAATDQEEVIDHLITIAWAKEIEPEKTIVQLEGEEPSKPSKPRKKITVHGQEYRSLRYACLEVWGLSESEYNRVNRQYHREGIDIHDLLAPRREPERRRLSTDTNGVVNA